jgi:hypothetical protein
MLRKLLIGLLLLIVVLVVVTDRVGGAVAGHVLAGKLQTDEDLPSRPSVSISGFPFLTQAFHGRYSDVSVTAHGYKTTDGVQIQTLKIHLHGMHVPLSHVLKGSVSRVPVDHVDGTAFLSFADVVHYLAGQAVTVTLSRASPGAVEVIRQVHVGGHTKLLKGVAAVAVNGANVTLALAASAAPKLKPLVLSIPLRGLPFRINVTSVQVTAGGLLGAGTADHVTLGS